MKVGREETRNREKVGQIRKKNQVHTFQYNYTDITLNMT